MRQNYFKTKQKNEKTKKKKEKKKERKRTKGGENSKNNPNAEELYPVEEEYHTIPKKTRTKC